MARLWNVTTAKPGFWILTELYHHLKIIGQAADFCLNFHKGLIFQWHSWWHTLTAWGAVQRPSMPLGRILSLSSWELHHMLFPFPLWIPQHMPSAPEAGTENRKVAPTKRGADLWISCQGLALESLSLHLVACRILMVKTPPHETALDSVFIIYFNLSGADPNIWFLSAMPTELSSVCDQLQNAVNWLKLQTGDF